ncbi:MAG: tetratricopeptide repeat protein [Deltaproteobacteria bacterium]|nr:tetratricopeptide repeat protein [Deltaproteobacteria bacterium]
MSSLERRHSLLGAGSDTGVRRAVLWSLLVGLLAGALAIEKVYDYDLWWHLATGDWILANRAVPRADPFGFATLGAPWVPHSWAAEIILASIFRAGGAAAVILWKAALVALAFFGAQFLLTRSGAHAATSALCLVVAMLAARFQFRERPQVLAFPLLVLFLFEARSGRPRLALVVPATIVWANFHGSFVLAPFLCATALAEGVIDRLLGRAGADVRPSAMALVACSLATLVNPFGLDLLLTVLRDFAAFAVDRSALIDEYRRLAPREHPLFMALLVASAAALLRTGRSARAADSLSFCAFNALAFNSVRFVGLAALVNAVILASSLQTLGISRSARIPRWVEAVAKLTSVALVVGALWFRDGHEAQPGLGVNERRFPVAAVEFLQRAEFSGNLFDTWELGGYLLYHLPQARVMIDGRCLEAQLSLQARLDRMDAEALQRFVDEHDVQGALLTRTDLFADFFAISPRFERVFFDDRAVVYLTRERAAEASRRGLPTMRFLRPESYDYAYLAPLAAGPEASEVEAELRRAVAGAPRSFTARFLLGFFLEAQQRPEALNHYLAAADLNPSFAFTHYGLGARAGGFALKLGRWKDAVGILERALDGGEPDLLVAVLLGTAQYQAGDLEAAAATFRGVLSREPDQLDVLINFGFLLIDTGRPVEAAKLFARAREVAPDAASPIYGLALAQQSAGDRGAAQTWRELLDRVPTGTLADRARAFLRAK